MADQSRAPYLEALLEYAARDPERLHVPGHKGGPAADPLPREVIRRRSHGRPRAVTNYWGRRSPRGPKYARPFERYQQVIDDGVPG